RHAAVGDVVLLDVQVIDVHAGGRAQAEGQRGCEAPAVVLDIVATVDVALLVHPVEANRGGRVELLVDVGGAATTLAAAALQRAGLAIAEYRLLGHQVDRTGRRGATVLGAVWTLGDFDLLDVEHVARHGAGVA